jgi:hypothetical protein
MSIPFPDLAEGDFVLITEDPALFPALRLHAHAEHPSVDCICAALPREQAEALYFATARA